MKSVISDAFAWPVLVSFLQLENLTLVGVEFENAKAFLSLLLPPNRLLSLNWEFVHFSTLSAADPRSPQFDRNELTPELTVLDIAKTSCVG
jgi:hypothetical protein